MKVFLLVFLLTVPNTTFAGSVESGEFHGVTLNTSKKDAEQILRMPATKNLSRKRFIIQWLADEGYIDSSRRKGGLEEKTISCIYYPEYPETDYVFLNNEVLIIYQSMKTYSVLPSEIIQTLKEKFGQTNNISYDEEGIQYYFCWGDGCLNSFGLANDQDKKYHCQTFWSTTYSCKRCKKCIDAGFFPDEERLNICAFNYAVFKNGLRE